MTIQVTAAVTPIFTITSDTSTNCSSTKIVDVDHQGTNLYIKVLSSGFGATMNFTETITADKTYTLEIHGNNSGDTSKIGSILLEIRELTAGGNLLATVSLQRAHSGNYC